MSDIRESRNLTRRGFIQLGAGAGAAAALAACAPGAPTTTAPGKTTPGTTAAPKTAGAPKQLAETLTYAHSRAPSSFDPAFALSNTGFGMARQIYDALVTWDKAGTRIVPQLAASWQRLNPTTWEFELRDDVKFQNGEDFTSESVVWTLERILNSTNPSHANTKGRMGPIVGAEAVDSTTVRVMTSGPDPITLNRLVSLFMLPPRYGAEAGDEGIGMQPVGTGSFRGVEIEPNTRAVFEAWDEGWRGPSTIKQATWLRFSDDAAMVAALRTGDVDIIFRVEPDQAQQLESDFNLMAYPAGSATQGSILQQNNPALRDVRVRRALNHAVNKEEFVDVLLLGRARPLDGQLLPPGLLGYNDDIAAFEYDPELARSLLADAGHPDLELTLAASSSLSEIVEGVAGYLEGVGIRTTINLYEGAVASQQITVSTEEDTLYYNMDYFHMRDFDIFVPTLALKDQPHFEGNAEFRELAAASRTEPDEERRAEMIRRMAQIMHDEASQLFLFEREIITPHSKKIRNLTPNFDTATYFWEVEKEA